MQAMEEVYLSWEDPVGRACKGIKSYLIIINRML
jgi:hypothetical protein